MQLDLNFRTFLADNLLTTSEVAEVLQMSRQRVVELARQGKLVPIKQSSSGLLFLRADVAAFKDKVVNWVKGAHPKYMEFYGSTAHSLSFFHEHVSDMGRIMAVFIYFDPIDAAHDHFFVPSELFYGRLQSLSTAHMVIRDENNQEMWLGGCNCGYEGAGPHGSETILKELKFPQDKLNDIFDFRVVKFFRDDDYIDVVARDSSFKSDAYLEDDGELFLSDGNLVLLQRDSYKSNELTTLRRYRKFLPDPTEVLLLTSEQAYNLGYYASTKRFQTMTYNVIIRDYSGREIWLATPISKKPVSRQGNLLDILQICGFDMPQSSAMNDFASWLQTIVRRTDPTQPMHRIVRSK